MAEHRLTDPACRYHREPRTRLGQWWFDRNRGRSCHECVPPLAVYIERAEAESEEGLGATKGSVV